MLDESVYNGLTASVFKRLTAGGDGIDPDVLDTVATGDMVTCTAASGEKSIVNTQRAVSQMWVAGKGEGVHFSLGADGRWLDDKQKGLELSAWVAECVRDASGVAIAL